MLAQGRDTPMTELNCDAFLGRRLRLWQPVRGYLAAMVPALPPKWLAAHGA